MIRIVGVAYSAFFIQLVMYLLCEDYAVNE